MPRKKTESTVVETVLPDDEQVPADAIPVNELAETNQQADDLKTFLSKLGEECPKITIHRYTPNKPAPAYVGSTTLEDISEEMIQTEYGGGKFQVKFFNEEGAYVAAKTIHIEGPRKDLSKVENPAPEPAQPSTDPAAQAFQMQLTMLQQQIAAQQDLMLKVVEKLGTPAQAPISVTDVVQLMGVMNENKKGGDSDSASNWIEILKLGVDIAGNGGRIPDTGWSGVIKEVAGAVPGVLASMKQAAAPATAPPTDPEKAAQMVLVQKARDGINYLKPKAIAGDDVNLYIHWVAANANEPMVRPLLGLLSHPYEKLIELDAELAEPHLRPWFETLYTGLKNAFQSPDTTEVSTDEDSGGGAGHVSEPSDDAPASA